MNFETASGFSRHFCYFQKLFPSWELTSQRARLPCQSGQNKLEIGRPSRVADVPLYLPATHVGSGIQVMGFLRSHRLA